MNLSLSFKKNSKPSQPSKSRTKWKCTKIVIWKYWIENSCQTNHSVWFWRRSNYEIHRFSFEWILIIFRTDFQNTIKISWEIYWSTIITIEIMDVNRSLEVFCDYFISWKRHFQHKNWNISETLWFRLLTYFTEHT